MVTAWPQNELRSRINFQQTGRNKICSLDFGDLLVVKAIRRIVALVVVSEQLSGGERVVCLLAEGAVRNIVLTSEGVGIRGIDPGDVEVIPHNREDCTRMVRLTDR